MRKLFALLIVVATATTAGVAFARETQGGSANVRTLRDISLEFVGQFQNSAAGVTPITHFHYGYLAYIKGTSTFKAAQQDETSALYTFYAVGTTLRIIANGPFRIISRVGTITVYRDPSANSSFANPDTFRDGTPVLVATFRQQSVSDTVTGAVSVFHQNTITKTVSFDSGKGRVQIGEVGERFVTRFSGHLNMPGPPSGFIAGYAVSE